MPKKGLPHLLSEFQKLADTADKSVGTIAVSNTRAGLHVQVYTSIVCVCVCVCLCFNHKQVLLNCCGLPVGQTVKLSTTTTSNWTTQHRRWTAVF